MTALTSAQARCLGTISGLAERGYGPTYQEIADGMGVSSKSRAHEVVAELVKRGLLRRDGYQPRSIEIVDRRADSFALERMSDADLRQHIAMAAGILAHRGGGHRG